MRRTPTTQKAATIWQRNILCAMLVLTYSAYGQPPIPKFESFQPVNLQSGTNSPTHLSLFQSTNPLSQNDPYREQNYRMMQQAGMTVPGPTDSRQRRTADVNAAISE